MTDLEKFLDLQRQAVVHYQSGENEKGIALQTRLVEQMVGLGQKSLQAQPRLKALLQDVTTQLVDTLRWEGQYGQAIQQQERLLEYFPESADVLSLGIANLRIESGEEEAGLVQMRGLSAKDPENIWVWISLGSSCLWLKRFAEAEAALKQAASITGVQKVDRAVAQKYLFELYASQEGHTEEAVAAWREGCRLDPEMKEMLPRVIRMLTYWREYAGATQLLASERDRVRKLFYQGLITAEFGNYKEGSGYWRSILLDIPYADLKAGQDEYAEACIRLVNPSTAIPILEPLVGANQINYFRLVILGLAWAQKQSVERASWYLGHAMRLGDLDRPRKTRPAPQGRILDIYARLLYYDIVINAEVREKLDIFFIPTKSKQV